MPEYEFCLRVTSDCWITVEADDEGGTLRRPTFTSRQQGEREEADAPASIDPHVSLDRSRTDRLGRSHRRRFEQPGTRPKTV